MSYSISEIGKKNLPRLLSEIADPPEKLYLAGKLPGPEYKYLCVVGSRKFSGYGRENTKKLIDGLSGHPVAIVSGLALGIDSIALEAALEAAIPAVGVPGSGLSESVIYPRSSLSLAKRIVKEGGALVSEFEPEMKAAAWTFPKRNRIMAGLSDAVLVIEAEERSGTLITARLALEYNRDVLSVPGPINSKTAEGSNRLIKEGAYVVTDSEDILRVLEIESSDKRTVDLDALSGEERMVIESLREPLTADEIAERCGLSLQETMIAISYLEIKGLIKKTLGKISLS